MKQLRKFAGLVVFGAICGAAVMVPYHFASAGEEPPGKWCDAAGTWPPPCCQYTKDGCKPTTTVVKTTLPEVTTTVPDSTTTTAPSSTTTEATSTTLASTTTAAAPSTTSTPGPITTDSVTPPSSLRGPSDELPRTGAATRMLALAALALTGLGVVVLAIRRRELDTQ